MNFHVYILFSAKLNQFYVGQTNNINKRLERHNKGYENFTKKGIPWELIYHVGVESRSDAMKLERKLKNLKSNIRLKKWIEENS